MLIEHLYYFLDLVKTESISDSSRRLYISQQGLSKAIQNLEKEFDLPLFNRRGNRVAVTGVGRDFAETAQEMLDTYQVLRKKSVFYHAKQDACENYTVYVSPYLLHNLFKVFDGVIEEKACELNLSIMEKQTIEMDGGPNGIFASEDCLCLAEVMKKTVCELVTGTGIVFDSLSDYQTFAKVDKNSFFANKEQFFSKELVQVPLIEFDDPILKTWLLEMLKQYGKPNVVVCTRDREEMNRAIKESKLVGFTSELAWQKGKSVKGFVAIPIIDAPLLTIGAFYRVDAVLPQRAILFLDYLRDLFKTC